MTALLPRLLAPLYPACGTSGAAGVPPPSALDFNTLRRPRPRHACLAAPPGMHVQPDILTRRRDVPPARLFATLCAVIAATPRTAPHGEHRALLQAHYVVRSARGNFPHLVTVQVTPDSMPLLYARGLYGPIDFGANRRRLLAWLAALDARLDGTAEPA